MSIVTINDIKLSLGESERRLEDIACERFGQKPKYFRILKKSLDARKKNDIKYVYSIEFSDSEPPAAPQVKTVERSRIPQNPIVIAGSGPAGLFCALTLIEHGIQPIIIERGDKVEDRVRKTMEFFENGSLDEESNIQFGEGGAGTFSDGKLNTQTHSPLIFSVLSAFVRFGAPEEILYLQKPHIGSDVIRQVIINMRNYILSRGGEILFRTRLDGVHLESDKVKSVSVTHGGTRTKLDVSSLVVAIGHSARDTFEMLKDSGVYMRQKDFAVGVRIEHLQRDIGKSQYGNSYRLLPAADYKAVYKGRDRSAFTFCMCPGGYVMPAASERGGVVTNGMSNYARDGANANSALVVQIRRSDFGSDEPLAGVEFQRKIERKAFEVAGGNYSAPVQLVGDFMNKRKSARFGSVLPTYARGTEFAALDDVLPEYICDVLRLAITDIDKRLRGFASAEAVMTAPETRTSSPVRMERTERLNSVSAENLYPCGEGAGYAGGITSAAVDGIKTALEIIRRL